MYLQLFRLNLDEAKLIQFFRTLAPDSQTMLLATAEIQAEKTRPNTENVIPIASRRCSP